MSKTNDASFFAKIAWCKTIIDDPDFYPLPSSSRYPKVSTEDSLFATTLNSKSTVAAWQCFGRKPTFPEDTVTKEVRILASLGTELNSYPNILHGGFEGVLAEEASSVLEMSNKTRADCPEAYSEDGLTASLSVKFMKPIYTPQVVLITAAYTKVEGKKRFQHIEIKDGEGGLLATAEILYVRPPPGKKFVDRSGSGEEKL
ncbi:MAG: hypothetical protein Q9224_004922 [Gallowayella concinna]